MKIEKISNTQVKFILTKSDLSEHDIKITELAYGSEKAQVLFRHMMEKAFVECSFEADNTPLMIEAIPTTSDSIVIIVTKVTNPEQIEEKFNMLPRVKDIGKAKFKPKRPVMPAKSPDNTDIAIFSFDCIDRVINVSQRLNERFTGTTILFKHDNRYFLFASNDSPEDNCSMENLETVMGEYGQKHTATVISRYFLEEHGETIIGNDVIQKLAKL